MAKLSIGDQVIYNGRECEVVAEYYPYRFTNPSSKARHYLLKPTKPSWQGSRYNIRQGDFIFYDTSLFTPTIGSVGRLTSLERVFSGPVNSKNLKVLTTVYDPSQQPWEDGDI